MAPLAPLVLDHTLADLYSQDGDASKLVAVFAYPTPRGQGTASAPLSKKFTYQTPLAPSTNKDAVARRRLHNIPLKMAFVLGNMPLMFFDLDPSEKEEGIEGRSHHIDAFDILNQLPTDQQPDLSFVSHPEDITLPHAAEVVALNPLDRTAHLPHVVHPEIHYDLLSKRGLAYSGLPTPQTSIIDSMIVTNDDGLSPRQLDDEFQRMMRPIYERELPFIVKVPQAVGGLGTFILRTETQRQAAALLLQPELRQMLQTVTQLNQHLHPCCLVLQEFVPGETLGLTMFMTQRGRPIFIGCCTSVAGEDGLWAGGTMSYAEQPELEKRFAGLMAQIAGFLHRRGYYGPAGADIIIDRDGRQLIIDLNVRVTGSYSLGCLKGHFQRRGLVEALLYSFSPRCSQREFRQHFQEELEDGSFVLITWTSDLPGGSSLALVCMAAPDRQQLKAFVSRVGSFVSATTKHARNCHENGLLPN